MELIWICYDFVMAVFMALILGWRTVMVSLWLGTGRGMAQGLEWKRSGRLARATVSPPLIPCVVNFPSDVEIADWAADHNPRSSQTSYLAIRTIYRKCMFGNSAQQIINLIITVFTSFSKQIHNKNRKNKYV